MAYSTPSRETGQDQKHQLMITTRSGMRENIRYRWIKDGAPGNLQTLRDMRDLVRTSLGLNRRMVDAKLSAFAHGILNAAGVASRDWRGELTALLDYTRQVTYRQDEAGGNDDIADARTVIKYGYGDCDDLTVLFATLAGLVGYETAFKAVQLHAETNGYDHVYVMVKTPVGVLAVDPTHPTAPVGWEVPGAKQAVTLPIFDPGEASAAITTGLSGFDSLLSTISKLATAGLSFVGQANAASSAGKQQVAALKSQWNDAVNQTLALVRSINARMPNGVTIADVQTAQSVYDSLAQFAAQAGGDIAAQWNDPNYGPSLAHYIQLYKSAADNQSVSESQIANSSGAVTQAAQAVTASMSGVLGAPLTSSLEGVIAEHPLLLAGGLIAAVALATRALSNKG